MKNKAGLAFPMYIAKFLLVFASLILGNIGFTQVKIGDNPNIIDTNSLLELEGETRVFVLTRLTNTQMEAITPLEGALVYNINERCIFNYDGNSWVNLCVNSGGLSLVDNGDGTYTVDDGVNGPLTFDGRPETITTLLDNQDGTYSYSSEDGTITTIQSSSTTIVDNGDGTYTVNQGNGAPLTFNGAPESITTLVDNGNGSYSYTSENGTITSIQLVNTTIIDNGDGTYTVDDGVGAPVTFNGAAETVTTLTDNGDGTISYANENNDVTTVSVGGGTGLTGGVGSVFFAGTSGAPDEDNAQLFWDNPNNRLGIGLNTGLTDELTVNGTIGVLDGNESSPAYRFIQDGTMGMFRNTDGELAFSTNGNEKMSIDDTAILINKANPFDTSPLVIRGKGVDQKLLAFQDENQGLTLFNLDFRFAGLHLDEVNKGTRLLIKVNEHMGVDTNDPQAALDVNGDFRVRALTPTVPGDTYVTVDANGFFHKSIGTISSKGSSSIQSAARWTNGTINNSLTGSRYVVPIFASEDYKDGGIGVYEVEGTNLKVREDGRYDLRTNISLLVSNINSRPTTLSLRFSINNVPVGTMVSLVTGEQNLASLSLNEVLQLNPGDKISVVLYSESDLANISLNDPGTCSFIINKVK